VTATSLDLSPRPGSASLPSMVRAQALMEARLLLRNGEQLVLALAIPLLVLIGWLHGRTLRRRRALRAAAPTRGRRR